jgi:WD40 repeat protein/uncharacterized caspase-like protein
MTASKLDVNDSKIALTSGRASLWAILVGVNAYQDSQIPVLHYSAADCCKLADVLVAATRQFPKKQIMSHHDLGAQMPVREAILASFAQVIEQAKPQDTVLFYFSGHGLIEPTSKRAVLCLNDTRSDRLLETGLQMQELLQRLDQCESRQQLIWLDACHSGELMIPGARDAGLDPATETTTALVQILQQKAVQNKGLYALLSCDQGQRSWEFPELGHGLFTYYLIQGLQGAAADKAGVISADGLYRYLYEQITKFIDQKNQAVRRLNQQHRQIGEVLMYPEYPLQTPKRIIDGVGNVVVGMRGATPARPPAQSAQAQQAKPQAERARTAKVNRPIYWHYLLWGWAAALGLGGLFWGARSLVPSVVEPAAPADSSASCNQRIELVEPIPKQVIEPQIILNSCGGEQPWQPVKVQALQEGNSVWATAFGLDNSLLVSAGGKVGEIWDLTKRQQTYVLGGHRDSVYSVAVSPDAKQVVTASADQTARIWDVAKGTLQHILKGHNAAIWSVKISPNGETIATASEDGTVKLWDVTTGRLDYSFEEHQQGVFAVAFSPKNDMIASASQDQTIKLWQRDGAVRDLIGHEDAVRTIAFSPDGTKLASGSWDQTVKIWDTQTGQLLNTLSGHSDRVVAIDFSPDGKILASGGVDQTIKLWNAANGTLFSTLSGQTDWIMSLAFSPDGKTLASGSKDQTILLWQK